ncbi:hypothetical protein ABT124_49640, partial [Streptomyces sp. NPDC001982]
MKKASFSQASPAGARRSLDLARRCLLAHIHNLQAGIRTLRHRLSLPIGERGSKRAPGGYRSKSEWF